MTITKYIAIWTMATLIAVGGGIGLTENFLHYGAEADTLRLDDQEATIRAINRAMPAVVSIAISYNAEVENFDEETGDINIERRDLLAGAGSGFLISADGLILTNRHVAEAGEEESSDYKVTLNSGKQYYAQLIGKDPVSDLAVMKIFDKDLPYLELADSNRLTIGKTVIAIGNALGRYDNSATKGIVSGLGRSVLAFSINGEIEDLQNVIQTDAEINFGNSGGPLIDLDGKVVGINVAKDLGGDSLGFAIPINEAKPVITSVKKNNRIIRAYLGVRYVMITPEIADEKKLSRTTGALLVLGDEGEPAVVADSPAAKVDLQEGDIIFEVDTRKIDERLPLLSYINQFSPGKRLGLKVQRGDKTFVVIITLDELKP